MSGWPSKLTPNMSNTSRSWKSAVGKRSITVGTTGSSVPTRVRTLSRSVRSIESSW
jgi:hypothetical protein